MRKFLLAGVALLGLTQVAHAESLASRLDDIEDAIEEHAQDLSIQLEELQNEQRVRDMLRSPVTAAPLPAPAVLPHKLVRDCNGGIISLPVGWTVDCH